jgi:hypothetical protein
MSARAVLLLAFLYLVFTSFAAQPAMAESVVEQNSNVVGRTAPGFYRGIPGMQDNEASCAINPILPRNIVCAWNASGGSDDLIGDTWLRFSESLDGGRRFYNRYLNGSNLDPATSVGQQFAADPVMMCWPGGCGTVMLAAERGESGGTGGGIYMQWMVDLNTESGFRKAFKVSLDQVYRSTGSKFADKPHAVYMLDEDNPGTVPVALEVEMPDGTVQTIEREWPKARILVVFALFNPSKIDIEILSMYTDDYGGSWSNPKQVAVTSGRDQGVSVAAIGDTVFYGFRRFANQGDTDDFLGVVATNRGQKVGKPFVIAEDVCVYDVPTLPATDNSTAAAARTNDFPWVGQDGSNFIMVYSERRFGPDGCLANPNEPSDSRIVALVGSANGKNWSSTPVEIDPNPNHGFQFMPVVDCSLGVCQVAWWDSRRDSARTRAFLEAQNNAAADAALTAFENLPILADFHFPFGIEPTPNLGYQFRRTADMYTRKIRLLGPGGAQNIEYLGESTRASRYREGLYPDGAGGVQLIERESNPFNVKAYKTNSVPFMSDYSNMTSVKHRYVFNPADLTQPPYWESNAGPNLLNPADEPAFWLSWTDARNMRGAIYTYRIDGRPPYARTPEPDTTSVDNGNDEPATEIGGDESLTAESVEDFNPAPDVCTPVAPQPAGSLFLALNNRTKDSDIYGAFIENRTTATSLNPTKTLGLIQRTYVIVVENEDESGKLFRLDIANQPNGFNDTPKTARASWKQLPFDPDPDPASDFQTVAPEETTFEAVGPRSSASVALFLVSDDSVNPVTVEIYDVSSVADPELPGSGILVNAVTVNGAIEAGPLLNADGTPNTLEIHNPFVYAPDYNNPEHYNPGHYDFSQSNPDLYNPDQFNPDQYNPDLFNPDLFNPDQFNPDLFNLTLSSSDDFDNPEIPEPDLTNVVRDPGGIVSKVDVNFGLQNDGNTLTPYTVDFAIADAEVLELITSGQIATQLIAWQNKQIDDVQFCTPRLVTENRVISAENNPDLTELTIPSILDNRAGALTYFVAPGDILQNTIRFIGPIELIKFVESRLRQDIISYVFTSQTANTGTVELVDEEQVISDRTPATFNLLSGTTSVLEANVERGALLPLDFVTASKNGAPVPVSCTPALGSTVPLDVLNGDAPTALSCSATADNGVTATLDMTISVVDTEAPVIDTSALQDIVVEADSADGSVVTYDYPPASDVWGVDPSPDVACVPDSGSLFAFQAPGPVTTVICTATDESGNESDPNGPPPSTFTVTVQDTTGPQLDGFNPLRFVPPDADKIVQPDSLVYPLLWGPFTVTDADPNLSVDCDPGTPVGGVVPPEYAFEFDFPIGTTTVVCTAADTQNPPVTTSFTVFVEDRTEPVITLLGDDPYTISMGSGPYVDPGATALNNETTDLTADIVVDDSEVDTTTAGEYTVYYSVTDASGNTGTATRTVIVEFAYGLGEIIATKYTAKVGSSNPLYWAWLDMDGNPVDSSADQQLLTIRDCDTGAILINPVGDPGASGFRFKADNWWQYNWDSMGEKGRTYCASVESGRTGQMQYSAPIRLR